MISKGKALDHRAGQSAPDALADVKQGGIAGSFPGEELERYYQQGEDPGFDAQGTHVSALLGAVD